MSGTNRGVAVQRSGRHPSSTVDSQLAHLENVVRQMARCDESDSAAQVFDREYWEKRIRALEAGYELVDSQRLRAEKPIVQLGGIARTQKPRRAA